MHTIFGVANDLQTAFLIRKIFFDGVAWRIGLRTVKVMAHAAAHSLCQAVNQISSESKCLGNRRRLRIASKQNKIRRSEMKTCM